MSDVDITDVNKSEMQQFINKWSSDEYFISWHYKHGSSNSNCGIMFSTIYEDNTVNSDDHTLMKRFRF